MSTFTRWPGDEGYDRMSFRSPAWLAARPDVGARWLGPWLLAAGRRLPPQRAGVCHRCRRRHRHLQVRYAAGDCKTDEIAFFCWKTREEGWVAGIDSHEQMPPHLRSPFSWRRLNESQGA